MRRGDSQGQRSFALPRRGAVAALAHPDELELQPPSPAPAAVGRTEPPAWSEASGGRPEPGSSEPSVGRGGQQDARSDDGDKQRDDERGGSEKPVTQLTHGEGGCGGSATRGCNVDRAHSYLLPGQPRTGGAAGDPLQGVLGLVPSGGEAVPRVRGCPCFPASLLERDAGVSGSLPLGTKDLGLVRETPHSPFHSLRRRSQSRCGVASAAWKLRRHFGSGRAAKVRREAATWIPLFRVWMA